MPETQEIVKEREVSQQGDTQVVRERTSTDGTAQTRMTIVNGIWLLLGIIEVILALRFILKLLGANPGSGFVHFLYAVSGLFVAPFVGIFSTPTTQGDIVTSVFETATIVAAIVYALVVWGVVKMATLNHKQSA
jgi:uncharacterized membrane protein